MRPLILFDNGGVLTRMDFRPVFEELRERTGLPIPELRERLRDSQAIQQGMIGKDQEFFRRYRNAIDPGLTDEEIVEFETSKARLEPIQEMVDLKKRLSEAGYPIGILSNSYSFTIAWLRKRFPTLLETYGGPAVFSDAVGVAKPDPAIYARIAGFEKVIFIEDKSSYLKHPVEQLGWTGILLTQFQDPEEPIRAIGHGEDHVDGMLTVATPGELDMLLRELGVRG